VIANWSRFRFYLLIACLFLVFSLIAVYSYESYRNLSSRGQHYSLNDELENGRKNKTPFPISFTVSSFSESNKSEGEDICGWYCLDQAVAPGLQVYILDEQGHMCSAITGDAILWGDDFSTNIPVTPLKQQPLCNQNFNENVIAVISYEKPSIDWINLIKKSSEDKQVILAYKNDQRLKQQLIEASSQAEGTLILPETIWPAPPLVMEYKINNNTYKLETSRFYELKENAVPAEYKQGYTTFSLNGQDSKRVSEHGLFCSDVLSAFNWLGKHYLIIREWGCDSDLVCQGVFEWKQDKFEIVYGNCN
jgi:hypothetical protein